MGKISFGNKIIYDDTKSGGGSSTFVELEDTPASYVGEAGKVATVSPTEDGLVYSNAPPSENGLPVGGTTGQVLAKVDDVDNNVEWVDMPSGGGSGGQTAMRIAMGGNKSSSGRTDRGYGLRFMALSDYEITGGFFYTAWDNGIVYTCKLWDTNNNVLASGVITGDGSTSWGDVDFATPYKVEQFKEYHISIEKPSGSIGKWYQSFIFPFASTVQSYTGLPGNINNASENYGLGINILL